MQNYKWILRKNSSLSLIYPFLFYMYQSNENIEHLLRNMLERIICNVSLLNGLT